MKWTRSELEQYSSLVEFEEDVTIDDDAFQKNSRINRVCDVHVEGSGYLNEEEDSFFLSMDIDGVMIVPDAITGKEIEYPFDTHTEEVYSFVDRDEDGVRLVDNDIVDTYQAVVDAIFMEVPMQVTHASKEDYPQGDGWRIVTEEEYQKGQEDKRDPRLAKLKELLKDDD